MRQQTRPLKEPAEKVVRDLFDESHHPAQRRPILWARATRFNLRQGQPERLLHLVLGSHDGTA